MATNRVSFLVRMEPELKAALEVISQRLELSLNGVISRVMADFVADELRLISDEVISDEEPGEGVISRQWDKVISHAGVVISPEPEPEVISGEVISPELLRMVGSEAGRGDIRETFENRALALEMGESATAAEGPANEEGPLGHHRSELPSQGGGLLAWCPEEDCIQIISAVRSCPEHGSVFGA